MTTTTKTKTYCVGSGADVDMTTTRESRWDGALWAKCPECGRVLKPTVSEKLRQHQPRNKATASLDATRDILWDSAPLARPHFALDLPVRVRKGARPAGWGDDPFDGFDDDDYLNTWRITGVAEPEGVRGDYVATFEAAGWYWLPTDLEFAWQ